MLDLTATTLALRNRAVSLMVATTGSTTLSATATGYARTAGSFVTDGFCVGMEITPAGFATNTVDIITGVTATDLTTKNARAVEVAASGRTISVGLPALRAFENVDFTPVSGRPYVEEDFIAATNTLLTTNASSGTLEETGLYVLKWYGLSNYGVSALRKSVDALKALFAPGTTVAVGSNTVRVRADVGPFTGQILPQDGGWSVLTLTIPWRAFSQNAIAA